MILWPYFTSRSKRILSRCRLMDHSLCKWRTVIETLFWVSVRHFGWMGHYFRWVAVGGALFWVGGGGWENIWLGGSGWRWLEVRGAGWGWVGIFFLFFLFLALNSPVKSYSLIHANKKIHINKAKNTIECFLHIFT